MRMMRVTTGVATVTVVMVTVVSTGVEVCRSQAGASRRRSAKYDDR